MRSFWYNAWPRQFCGPCWLVFNLLQHIPGIRLEASCIAGLQMRSAGHVWDAVTSALMGQKHTWPYVPFMIWSHIKFEQLRAAACCPRVLGDLGLSVLTVKPKGYGQGDSHSDLNICGHEV